MFAKPKRFHHHAPNPLQRSASAVPVHLSWHASSWGAPDRHAPASRGLAAAFAFRQKRPAERRFQMGPNRRMSPSARKSTHFPSRKRHSTAEIEPKATFGEWSSAANEGRLAGRQWDEAAMRRNGDGDGAARLSASLRPSCGPSRSQRHPICRAALHIAAPFTVQPVSSRHHAARPAACFASGSLRPMRAPRVVGHADVRRRPLRSQCSAPRVVARAGAHRRPRRICVRADAYNGRRSTDDARRSGRR